MIERHSGARIALAAAATCIAFGSAAAPVPQDAVQSVQQLAQSQARSVLRRLMAPAPDRARMARALAIAGLDGATPPQALDEAVARASAGYGGWVPDAERALLGRIVPELERTPGPSLPASCVRPLIDRWDEGLRFEVEAFDALLAALPGAGGDVAGLARTALRGFQWRAITPMGGQGGPADLRSTDLLEACLCRGAAASVPADQVRSMLGGYAAERARLLRRLAEATAESDARRTEASLAASAWSEARTAHDADPGQNAFIAGEWRRLALALQMAPVLRVSAELADLQRRTAEQVAAAVDPASAWSVYGALLSPGPACQSARRIAEAERVAAAVPPDQRASAQELLRGFSVDDRQRLQREVEAMARTAERMAAVVRSAADPSGISEANLDEIDAGLRALPLSPVGGLERGDRNGSTGAMDRLLERLRGLMAAPAPSDQKVP